MTQIKNKSTDEKRARRNRYKNACQPVKEMFGCTSMEVAGQVRTMIQQNRNLTERNAKLEAEMKELNVQIEAKDRYIETLEELRTYYEDKLKEMPEDEGTPTVV